MKFMAGMLAALLLALGGAAALVGSGVLNIAADQSHPPALNALLELARERSLSAHRPQVAQPDLADAALIRQGAGNYQAMCASCHLAPGMADTELSRGLNPPAPRLAEVGTRGDALRAFQIIRHGIAASGMPAWGPSMQDPYIWGMVAFIRQLPELSPLQYRELVAASEGHSHGGGESGVSDHHAAAADQHAAAADAHAAQGHQDAAAGHHAEAADHHAVSADAAAPAAASPAAPAAAKKVHVHADGSQHVHRH